MDFKQLQSFVTVVQEESFTQAAGRLFVSQSTVSTHIHQLESELNTKLILRTTKSLQITPKGRELYEYALNILELKERMIQACSIESRRIIHLGASTIPSAYILPQLLADFGKLHQDIYFIIHQSDSQGIINGLKDGLFNLGFIGMSCEDSDFCCQPFCKDRMVVITPVNEHFLQYKQQKENVLPELLREPLILREKGSDQETIKNLVAGGMGISIISEKAAHNFLQEKRLLAFELPQAFSERSLYLIYRKNYLLPSYVKEFLAFIGHSNL